MQVSSQRRGVQVPLAATLTLVAPFFGMFAPAAQAQQAASATPTERLITMELRDARLESAIAALSTTSGFSNFVIEPVAGKSFNMVTVRLTDKPLSRAVEAIASAAGAILTQEDGIYHLRPRTDADVRPAPRPATPPTEAMTAPARPRATQLATVRLNYILPSDFVKVLSNPAWLSIIGAIAPEPVKPPTPDNSAVSSAVNQLLNTPALGSNPSAAPTADPASVRAGSGSAGRDGSSYGEQGLQGFGGGRFGGGGQFGGGGGAAGFGGGGQAGGGQFGGGQAGGGQNGQATLRPPGITNLISNDADNALVVEYDNVEDLNRLREIVRVLDVKPKQVQIKAEFVAVTVGDADSFGIDWRLQPAGNVDVNIPAAGGSTGATSLVLAYATGNAVANLRAALTRSTTNVLQAPIISTVNNRPASINVSTTVSIAQSTIIPVQNGSPITSTTQVPVTASNSLTVTPHINGDNSINLVLQPTLQTITLRGDGGYDATTNTLTTTRIVQNGETMVLGGFITKTQQLTIQKVPLLSDLPIIGSLFTQRNNSTSGTETLVFVTPTIIEDQSQGVVGTGGASPAPTP